MSGRQDKKLRRELKKIKEQIAEEEIIRFRLWVRSLTIGQRLKLTWKVLRNKI